MRLIICKNISIEHEAWVPAPANLVWNFKQINLHLKFIFCKIRLPLLNKGVLKINMK